MLSDFTISSLRLATFCLFVEVAVYIHKKPSSKRLGEIRDSVGRLGELRDGVELP